MEKEQTYKVAGHIFRFCLPDNDKLWNIFTGSYSPFECPDVDETDLLFSLRLVENIPVSENRTCIYDTPTEDGETVVKLYRQDGKWLFETTPDHNVAIKARILASDDFKTAEIQLMTRRIVDAQFGINNAAMLLFAFASATRNTLEMHSSVIEKAGKAYLFLGKSGTGKSTHSSLWLKHIPSSTLMNDDNPIVRVWSDGSIIAYGSPWSGKTPCYKNIEAPVGAFVQIRQSPENKIRKMSVLEAYTSLYSSISGIKDDDSSIADGLNATIDKVLSSVPCYLLDCRPDKEAAEVCFTAVTKP